MAAASSGRSCTTAYGRAPGARIGEAHRLHRSEGERPLAALGHDLDRAGSPRSSAPPRTRAPATFSRARRSRDERAVACLVEGAVDVRARRRPPRSRPCRSATASKPCPSRSIRRDDGRDGVVVGELLGADGARRVAASASPVSGPVARITGRSSGIAVTSSATRRGCADAPRDRARSSPR